MPKRPRDPEDEPEGGNKRRKVSDVVTIVSDGVVEPEEANTEVVELEGANTEVVYNDGITDDLLQSIADNMGKRRENKKISYIYLWFGKAFIDGFKAHVFKMYDAGRDAEMTKKIEEGKVSGRNRNGAWSKRQGVLAFIAMYLRD